MKAQDDIVLKLDCEGCEWQVLDETPESTLRHIYILYRLFILLYILRLEVEAPAGEARRRQVSFA